MTAGILHGGGGDARGARGKALCIALCPAICALCISCADLYAYSIVLTTPYDGQPVIEREKYVLMYLENIVKNPGEFTVRAFNRKAISQKVPKTAKTTHSFYVIYPSYGGCHTLSFSATGKGPLSRGAWALDTETDRASLSDYTSGYNLWQVSDITPLEGIDTLSSLLAVIAKIRGKDTYYYKAKPDNSDSLDNCNTALFETLVIQKNTVKAAQKTSPNN
jgi:hypothetical protein